MGFDGESQVSQAHLTMKREPTEPGEDSAAPICVISSVHSATTTTPPAEDQKPDATSLDDFMRRNRYTIYYAESGNEKCGPARKKRPRGSRGHWMSKLAEARQNRLLLEQYWISCRFCANAFPEKVGINKVMCHEETEHPEEVESNQKSPYYKIFKVKSMNIDAFPEIPLRKKIFAKHPVSLEWPPKPKLSKPEPKSSTSTDGDKRRGKRSDYTVADCTCIHCSRVFQYPSYCRQHQLFCSERPDRVLGRRGRGPNPTAKVCPHCSQTCMGVSGLMSHFKVCPQRQRGRRGGTRRPSAKVCPHCSETCIGVSGLMAHFKVCSLRPRRKRLEGSTTCEKCQQTFKYPSMLAQHQLSSCRYNEARKCPPTLTMTTCPFCHRSYKFPSILWQHLKKCALARQAAAKASRTMDEKGQSEAQDGHGEVNDLSLALAALTRRNVNISLISPQRTTATVTVSNQVESQLSQPRPQREITTYPARQRSALAYLTCELCSHVSLSRMGMINHRHIVHKITTPPAESNTTSEQMGELAENPNSRASATIQIADEEKEPQSGQPLQSEHQVILPRDESQPKVYKCLQCYMPFPTRYKLVQHERIHTGEKPYKCAKCPATFARATTRNTHMKRQHLLDANDASTNANADPIKSSNNAKIAAPNVTVTPNGAVHHSASGHAIAFVKCRFCPMVLASAVGKTLHERFSHKALFAAAGPDEFTIRKNIEMKKAAFAALDKSNLTASDAAMALSLVKTQSGPSCLSDLVLVSQEQEFFVEHGEGENDVDPLMLPVDESEAELDITGRTKEEEVQEVMMSRSVKMMKALGTAVRVQPQPPPPVQFRTIGAHARDRGEEPMTFHCDEENVPSTSALDPFSPLKSSMVPGTAAREIEEITLDDDDDHEEMILPTVGDEDADVAPPPKGLPVSYIVPNTSTSTATVTSQRQVCTYKCVVCGVLSNSMASISQHVCVGVGRNRN